MKKGGPKAALPLHFSSAARFAQKVRGFNGASTQGQIAAYCGKRTTLAPLVRD
jgi:hypothetical protein